MQAFISPHKVLASLSERDRNERVEIIGRLRAPRWHRRRAMHWLATLAAGVGHYDVLVTPTIVKSPSRSRRHRLLNVDIYIVVVGPVYGVQAFFHLLERHAAPQ